MSASQVAAYDTPSSWSHQQTTGGYSYYLVASKIKVVKDTSKNIISYATPTEKTVFTITLNPGAAVEWRDSAGSVVTSMTACKNDNLQQTTTSGTTRLICCYLDARGELVER